MGRLLEKLRYAFAMDPPPDQAEAPLPDALERLAAALVERRIETLALVIVESMKPVSFLAGQTLHAVWPLVQAVGGLEDYRTVARALEDRRMLERFERRLESLARAQRGEPSR